MTAVLKTLGVVILVPVALLAIYLGYNAWDRYKLRSFCKDVHSGATVQSVHQIAYTHGIADRWIVESAPPADGETTLVMLASTEFGEMTCDVQLRDGKVEHAEVHGP